MDIISERHVKRRDERGAIEKVLVLHNSRITPDHVKTEIHRVFSQIEKSSGIKRSRVSQSIRDKSYLNIRKSLHHLAVMHFLKKYAESDQLRGIKASQINPPDLIESLTIAEFF